MLSLVYVSSATRPYSKPELAALLHQAREKNTLLNITGMLLYQSSSFLQVIEGDDTTIRSLYATIAADPRHTRVQTLIERPATHREFAGWSMAFHDLTDTSLRNTPGYSDYLNTPLGSEDYRKDPSLARRLLAAFRQNMKV